MYERILIPEPCAADWEAMTPEGKGRHCGQCCKTVVDFTQWENRDILAYLKKHASAGVCGHFRKEQLNTPIPTPEVFIQYINQSFLSFAQKIAAVCLFVFCVMAASCGNSREPQTPAGPQATILPVDSASRLQRLTGDTIAPPPSPEQIIQGEALPVPEPPQASTWPEPGPVLGGAPVIEAYPIISPPMQDSTGEQEHIGNKDTIR